MLRQRFDENVTMQSLEMLTKTRKSEFQTLANIMKIPPNTPNWEEFVLQYCMNVEEIFKIWTGDDYPIESNIDHQSMTLLRMISRRKKSMIEITNILNLAYTIAIEFKEIYSRLR